MNRWHKNGYGRIFVPHANFIEIVSQVVREIDPEEWEDYAPADLVGPFDPKDPKLVALGKFDTPIDLITARCWAISVPVWCCSMSESDFPLALLKGGPA